MTRKDRARLGIEGCRGEPRIERGVLDIGMSQSILHKSEISTSISTSIKSVCRHRMLQAMKFPFLHGNPCHLLIRLHEMVQHAVAKRHIANRYKCISDPRCYTSNARNFLMCFARSSSIFIVAWHGLLLASRRIAVNVMTRSVAHQHTARPFELPDQPAALHKANSMIW